MVFTIRCRRHTPKDREYDRDIWDRRFIAEVWLSDYKRCSLELERIFEILSNSKKSYIFILKGSLRAWMIAPATTKDFYLAKQFILRRLRRSEKASFETSTKIQNKIELPYRFSVPIPNHCYPILTNRILRKWIYILLTCRLNIKNTAQCNRSAKPTQWYDPNIHEKQKANH